LFLKSQPNKIFYGWWIALTALAVNAILSGPTYGATGLWIDSLERDFGWARGQLSWAFSLGQLEGSIAAPIVGYLIDRYGGKKIAISGAFVGALGYVLLSATQPFSPTDTGWNDPLIFYLAYLVIMLGSTLGAWIPMTVIINNWFDKKRSLAMSIGGLGFSVGTFAIVPLIALLVLPENLGWRLTAVLIALIFLLVPILIWKSVKNSPEDIGEIPDGLQNKKRLECELLSGEDNNEGFTIGEAIREKSFWYISIGHGASAMLTSTMMVHLILAFKNQGLTIEIAALIWGISMGIGGISQLLGGIIGDKVTKRYALFFFGCLQAIGVALAVTVTSIWSALIFATIYGMGFGARAPITTAMRGEYFGRKSFGKIMGISAIIMMIMTMIGPVLAGTLFDRQQDYTTAFVSMAILGAFGSIAFLFAKKPIHPAQRSTNH
tara:strand:+ start:3236 stop:4540 length:1305 start_codon:yes stop_codon:yes gene_type:complete